VPSADGGAIVPGVDPSVDLQPPSRQALLCRRKFLRFFRKGFRDPKYVDWERGYKEAAHEEWEGVLGRRAFETLLAEGAHEEIAARAVRIESRTNLLFSFEKMALRDAVRGPRSARLFAGALHALAHGKAPAEERFTRFGETLSALPRRQTRVHTWPLQTVFGFIARPDRDIFLKPTVTRLAAEAYGYPFQYASRPSWPTYASLLGFARVLARDLADLEPRDMIDLQSFIWVLGSSEYD
jgi:hypothetical protein